MQPHLDTETFKIRARVLIEDVLVTFLCYALGFEALV